MFIRVWFGRSGEANSDADSWGIWKSEMNNKLLGYFWTCPVCIWCVYFLYVRGSGWPGLEEPWRGNWRGSAASWHKWRSKDLHNARAGWQTASVWSRCAGGFPFVRRTCPSCRSAPGHTQKKNTSAKQPWQSVEETRKPAKVTCFMSPLDAHLYSGLNGTDVRTLLIATIQMPSNHK